MDILPFLILPTSVIEPCWIFFSANTFYYISCFGNTTRNDLKCNGQYKNVQLIPFFSRYGKHSRSQGIQSLKLKKKRNCFATAKTSSLFRTLFLWTPLRKKTLVAKCWTTKSEKEKNKIFRVFLLHQIFHQEEQNLSRFSQSVWHPFQYIYFLPNRVLFSNHLKRMLF